MDTIYQDWTQNLEQMIEEMEFQKAQWKALEEDLQNLSESIKDIVYERNRECPF